LVSWTRNRDGLCWCWSDYFLHGYRLDWANRAHPRPGINRPYGGRVRQRGSASEYSDERRRRKPQRLRRRGNLIVRSISATSV